MRPSRASSAGPIGKSRSTSSSPFAAGEISDADLGRMANEAYATFRHPAVVPLDQIGPNQFLLELFHGPTLAFKDVAMQLISRLMDHVLAKRAQRTTIVVATSGDTGGAAVDAFAGLDNVDLVVLFPNGRISEVQRRMMTTIGRRQRACARHRRHFRRLPGDREGAVQPSRFPRRGLAVRRQFDQLGAHRRPGGLLLHLGGGARRARAHAWTSRCRPAISATSLPATSPSAWACRCAGCASPPTSTTSCRAR